MQLTAAQKTLLKTHLSANTNTVLISGTPTAINTLLTPPFNGTTTQLIADWYNGLASGGDNQAFSAPRNNWNPKTTIALLNTAIKWQDLIPHDLGGSPSVTEQMLARNEKWMRWQSMTWNQQLGIDMTDSQVRQGVLAIFGDTSTGSANNIAKTGTGRLDAKRIEMVMNGNALGASAGNAFGDSHICPNNVLGQTLTSSDVEDAILNG